MRGEKFLGQWQLLPELSIYQHGDPPQEGSYSIRLEDNAVHFDIAWRDSAGQDHRLSFGGPMDGQRHGSDSPGVSHVSYARVSENILDSTAFQGETVLMYARRCASGDGSLLAVSQELHTPQGPFTNFQVYRRSAA